MCACVRVCMRLCVCVSVCVHWSAVSLNCSLLSTASDDGRHVYGARLRGGATVQGRRLSHRGTVL